MPFLAVLTVVLLLIAALGQSWWWRTATDWYGGAAFAWGILFLSIYICWPTLRALI